MVLALVTVVLMVMVMLMDADADCDADGFFDTKNRPLCPVGNTTQHNQQNCKAGLPRPQQSKRLCAAAAAQSRLLC
eukprot:11199031-Lingulodinium_polyedra.AAC.1